jgi:hypothetical protein
MNAIVPARLEAAGRLAAGLAVSATAAPASRARMASLEQSTAVGFATISCSFPAEDRWIFQPVAEAALRPY